MSLKGLLKFREKIQYEILVYTNDTNMWCIYDL